MTENTSKLLEALKALYSVTVYQSGYSAEEKMEAETLAQEALARAEIALKTGESSEEQEGTNRHGLLSDVPVLWKVDEEPDFPIAVIEDNADGMGLIEVGERTPKNLALAQEIVDAHNRELVVAGLV